MLQDPDVAGHERWCRKPKNLPERKIPRHDRQHDTKRLKGHPTSSTLHLRRLVGEEFFGILGVVGARCCTFLRLGRRSLEWLPHLDRHQSP